MIRDEITVLFSPDITGDDIISMFMERCDHPDIGTLYPKLEKQELNAKPTKNKMSVDVTFKNPMPWATKLFLDSELVQTSAYIQRMKDGSIVMVNNNKSGTEYVRTEHTSTWVPDASGAFSCTSVLTFTFSNPIAEKSAHLVRDEFFRGWRKDMEGIPHLTQQVKKWKQGISDPTPPPQEQ